MGHLAGTHGLVVGVANKRSIAWAIAKAADAAGASLTLSYATERFERNARALAETLTRPCHIAPCDVTNDDEVTALVSRVGDEHEGLDFLVHAVAFASREAMVGAVPTHDA